MAESDEILQFGSDAEREVWQSAYGGALARGSKLPDRDADAAVRAYRLRSGKRRLEEVGGTGAAPTPPYEGWTGKDPRKYGGSFGGDSIHD